MSNKYQTEELRLQVEKLHKEFLSAQAFNIVQRMIQTSLLALILWRVW